MPQECLWCPEITCLSSGHPGTKVFFLMLGYFIWLQHSFRLEETMAAFRTSNRNIILSSDDILPPSDPPEVDTEDENNNISKENETNLDSDSDDIPLEHYHPYEPTSDDIPLISILQQATTSTPHTSANRPRSSSVPAPYRPASSNNFLYTPRTERLHRMNLMT